MFKAIDRLGLFLKNWSISKKILAVIFVIGFVISLIPIIITCFYSVPVYDDYNFGLFTHKNVVSGDSFIAGIIETNNVFYNSWQGFFTANIIASAQPYNINVNLYFISNLLVIITLIFSLFYFSKVILKDILEFDFVNYILITIPIISVIIQFLPDIAQGFYWMDGSLIVLINAIMFLEFSFVIKFHISENKKQKITYSILSIICALCNSGADVITYLTLVLVFIVAIIYSLKNKHSVVKLIVILLSIATIGFIISMIAPGNMVRLSNIDDSSKLSIPMAIIYAIFYSITLFGKWTTISFAVVLLFCSFIFYNFAKKSKYNFKNPLLVFIISFGVYASRLSVELYALGTLGAPRQYDIYFLGFVLTMSISVLYFIGWISKKDIIKTGFLSTRKISVVLLLVIAFVFGAGCFDFGVKNMSSCSTALSLVKGETQQYSVEMHDRIAIYEDENIKDVIVKPLSVYPNVFMTESLKEDSNYWTNRSVAKYYNKNSVILENR